MGDPTTATEAAMLAAAEDHRTAVHALEMAVGLHESLEVVYLVDCYEATLRDEQDRCLASATGPTLAAACVNLGRVLRDGKWRRA